MAILTISREFGSGGREIGRAVATTLGYAVVDRQEILMDPRIEGQKWEEWARGFDERSPTVWERYDRSFKTFGALTQSILLDHAVKDRIVIIGRGGSFLLKDVPFALRIRVIAPMDARIKRIMQRESIDRETARWLAEKTDRERDGFLVALYGIGAESEQDYDAVYNTGHVSLEEVVASVTSLLKERERFDTEEARNLLRMRAAAASVKAGLFMALPFFLPTLEVESDGKTIAVKGIIHNPKELRIIKESAKALAEDYPMRYELHYRK